MEEKDLQEAAVALQQAWGLQLPPVISEQTILEQLTARVIYFLERGPEAFFQLMYRLDISERKLNAVMNETDVAQQIARLIYDRQIQKIRSRHIYKSSNTEEDPELQW